MITSEIGLLEIPHLTAPAGLDDLSRGVLPVRDRNVLPVDLQLVFIRGVKNAYPSGTTYRDIRRVDLWDIISKFIYLSRLYDETSEIEFQQLRTTN